LFFYALINLFNSDIFTKFFNKMFFFAKFIITITLVFIFIMAFSIALLATIYLLLVN